MTTKKRSYSDILATNMRTMYKLASRSNSIVRLSPVRSRNQPQARCRVSRSHANSFKLPSAFSSCVTGLTFGSALILTNGCGVDSPQSRTANVMNFISESPLSPRKIIGENDLVPVAADGSNIPSVYQDHLDAFGRMSMTCTATHIGHGLVLTAGHCFRATSFRQENLPCDHVTVEWGVREGMPAYLVSRCERVLVQETSEEADYALFKVDEIPRAAVSIASRAPQFGEMVTLFGHPQHRPLEWSRTCPLVDPVEGGFPRADFAHQCDTEVGNSGSAMLDAQTGEIIGVHDGGVTPHNYGTFIASTPITNYERYYTGQEPLPLDPIEDDGFTFGKLDLGHDQKEKLLISLSKDGKEHVNFKLTVNLEGRFDSVVLIDATGRRSSEIRGKESFDMMGMKAPVEVRFSSDSQGLSTLVRISQIRFL